MFKLLPGDRLLEADGAWSELMASEREEHPEGVAVFNFRVGGTHTYFVRAEGSGAAPVWVHNASASYAKGAVGTNLDVDAIAYEIEAAATRAETLLARGGTGGTAWGRIYRRYSGTGTWRERVAYGNAIQQIADGSLRTNTVMRAAGVVFNRARPLGAANKAGNLIRPEYQIGLGGGQYAIFDISTYRQVAAGKIGKYGRANPRVRYLVDIGY